MGSLPPHDPTNSNTFRIYASFCPKKKAKFKQYLSCYDPTNNSWSHVGPIPGLLENHVLKGFALVSLGEFVYVIGGRLCRCDRQMEADVVIRPDVLRFDVRTGEWSTCAPVAVSRFDFACDACDGKIYVAGGQCDLASARGTAAAEVYDPLMDRWTPLPEMTTARYKCVGVTWQGRFHVVGGFAASAVERSSAEAYDVERRDWNLAPGMWQLDVPPNQIVATEGRLFSSGDCLQNWKGHIEEYDGKLKLWNIVERSHLPDLLSLVADGLPAQTLYLTVSSIGSQLYFLMGYQVLMGNDNLKMVSVAHMFDTAPLTGEGWRSFEPIEEEGDKELCCHSCVVQLS
ncbi:F-box/kelch-repeat protein At1g67480-like [Typha latifolia]|uniref:F-box/kelch-repeat protein At1g67480-like n=1 Tax=Typha latifolia TaxID=4733 RepID=UPI003C2D34D7